MIVVMIITKNAQLIQWGSLALSIVIPTIAWLQYYGWQLPPDVSYSIYPLFGVVAFCIMATHFYFHALTAKNYVLPKNVRFSALSAGLVLLLLLSHPMVLYASLLLDGFGLPPLSAYEYYGWSLAPYIMMGVFGLCIFLAYEVARHLQKKPYIQKNWFLVIVSQYVAMALIYAHSFTLGPLTNTGWFAVVWQVVSISVLVSAWFVLPYEYKKFTATRNKS